MLCFASDNWAGAHPDIAANLTKNAEGFAAAYGGSELDRKVAEQFSELFEREVAVFFVATGTAANALSLTACNRPGGISFCHSEAHVAVDELGAVGYFTGGSRLWPVGGANGKINATELDDTIERFKGPLSLSGRPMAISLTQATEIGTVYGLDEISKIAAIAKKHELPLHMDGARFANALVALDATPAEMTWKNGLDILSFGGTKNGCWCAEAVIMFDLDRAKEFAYLRHRAGQLFSKSRFIAAQFEAYLQNGLWLQTARHANAMALKLANILEEIANARLPWPTQANEVFVVLEEETAQRLLSNKVMFHPWETPADHQKNVAQEQKIYRFVTSFATTQADIDEFAVVLSKAK